MIFNFNVFETDEGFEALLEAYDYDTDLNVKILSKTFETEAEANVFKNAVSQLLGLN